MIHPKKLKELSLFLNIDLKVLRQMDKSVQDLPGFAKWINIAVADWDLNKIDQKNREQVENWFKNNDKYIFELSDVHSRPTKQKIIRQAIYMCKKHVVKKLLDYGGGIGEDAIFAAKKGFNVSMADLPSHTLEFAKWRATHHQVRIKFIEIKDDQPLQKKYDGILCFEVLQHLFDPEIIALHFIEHLNYKGCLFITTRFHNPGYTMALKSNFKYDEGMEKFFTKKGLTLLNKIYQYGARETAKHLYIYRKL